MTGSALNLLLFLWRNERERRCRCCGSLFLFLKTKDRKDRRRTTLWNVYWMPLLLCTYYCMRRYRAWTCPSLSFFFFFWFIYLNILVAQHFLLLCERKPRPHPSPFHFFFQSAFWLSIFIFVFARARVCHFDYECDYPGVCIHNVRECYSFFKFIVHLISPFYFFLTISNHFSFNRFFSFLYFASTGWQLEPEQEEREEQRR